MRPSDRMSTAWGTRVDPFSNSPKIRSELEPRTSAVWAFPVKWRAQSNFR